MIAAKFATMRKGRPSVNGSIEPFTQDDAAKMVTPMRARKLCLVTLAQLSL
jgi:hypothetical protein